MSGRAYMPNFGTPQPVKTVAGVGTAPYLHEHNGVGSLATATSGVTYTKTTPNNTPQPEQVMFSLLVPAGVFKLATTILPRAAGLFNINSGQPVMTVRIRVGPTTLTGAIACTIIMFTSNGATNKTWNLDLTYTIRSIGVGGTGIGQGFMATNMNTQAQYAVVHTDQVAAVAVDTTINNLMELTAEWSANGTGHTFEITSGVMQLVDLGA